MALQMPRNRLPIKIAPAVVGREGLRPEVVATAVAHDHPSACAASMPHLRAAPTLAADRQHADAEI
jgi:hypothetical protein